MAEQTLSSPVRASVAERPKGFASKRFQENAGRTIATIVAILGAVVVLFPMLWMLSTALKSQVGAMKMPPVWIPETLHWENFYDALTFNPFVQYFINTLYYAIGVMIAETLVNSFISFGFARVRAPGRNMLFMFVLATLMLPPQVTLIPQYYLFSKLNWLNTFLPMMVPAWFGSAYLIFMIRQFYMTIPKEYDEAAIMEGASYFTIWRKIMLPLSTPVLGAVAIMSFMFHYNEYFRPIIYLNDNSKFTVQLGLSMFNSPFGGTPLHWLMAASLAVTLPCIIIFFFAQRFFIQGVVVSGVKG